MRRSVSVAPLAGCSIAAIVLLLGALAWPAVTDVPFFTKGEPREGLVVQSLVRGEGLVLPLRNGDEIPSKPPLFHWMGALASLALDHEPTHEVSSAHTGARDVSEAAVRMPSLLAALAVSVATALTAYRWFGATTAILALLVLGTSGQWLVSSVAARVDMVLAAAVSLALLSFARNYEQRTPISLVAFGLVTAAVLAKGPVGLVLPVAIVLVFLALRGDLSYLGRREASRLAVAAGVAVLWYLAAFAIAGDAFVAKQILKENFYRVIDPDSVEAGHVRPLWFYGPLLLAGFAPWSLFLPAFAAALWPRRSGWREVPLLLPTVWSVVTIALFSLAGSKRGVYLLPAYPALALLGGQAWNALASAAAEPDAATSPRGISVPLAFLVAGTVLVAAVTAAPLLLVVSYFAGLPVAAALDVVLGNVDMQNVPAVLTALGEHRGPLLLWCAVALAALVMLLRSMRSGRWAQALGFVAASVLALAALASTTILPALARHRSPEPFLQRIAEVVPADAPLSFYGGFDYAAVFYRGMPIPFRARLTDVPEPDGAWLLTWRASLPALEEEAQKLVASDGAAATYDVDEVLYDADAERPDRPSLVLAHIVRRIGDERSGGK